MCMHATPSSKQVSVRFATEDGSAQNGDDYVKTSGTLNYARGQTSKTITVLVNGDTTVEENETFVVRLGNAHNAFVADSRGLGTIVNDDVLPPPPPPVDPPTSEPDPYYDPYANFSYEDYANYYYYSGYNF